MPSKSKKQAKLMRAVAHGWKPTRIKGPSRRVAREFVKADKRKGYAMGGLAALGSPRTVPVKGPGGLRTTARRALSGGRTSGLGTFGSNARTGPVGSPSRAGRGSASPRTAASGALSTLPASSPRGTPSNGRPRPLPVPGRGVNPLLATSGARLHDASQRLSALHRFRRS